MTYLDGIELYHTVSSIYLNRVIYSDVKLFLPMQSSYKALWLMSIHITGTACYAINTPSIQILHSFYTSNHTSKCLFHVSSWESASTIPDNSVFHTAVKLIDTIYDLLRPQNLKLANFGIPWYCWLQHN